MLYAIWIIKMLYKTWSTCTMPLYGLIHLSQFKHFFLSNSKVKEKHLHKIVWTSLTLIYVECHFYDKI